jgi:hypothetical protein
VKKKSQAQCDKLLTPIVKMMHPVCLLNGYAEGCTYETQVAHHHVHKSKSLILRYNFDNLIHLCNHCHLMLHFNESYWASKIVQIKGLDWFESLEKEKNKIYKPNYDEIYNTLKEKERIIYLKQLL